MQMFHPLNRRRLLRRSACGFGSLALASLCADGRVQAAANPLVQRQPLFAPRAKRVIFVFMQGGPSHVDTFDYKPTLEEHHGEALAFRDARREAKTGMTGEETVMKSLWQFRQYGESGHWVSNLFPEIGRHVDDLCFIHSMHTNGVAHGPSTLFLHTGATNVIRPSVGSWITYGLGTENQNLPGFITICPSSANGGPRNFSNAFLPTHYQGTAIGRAGISTTEARLNHLTNPSSPIESQRRQFELLQGINQEQLEFAGGDDELEAVISSYELAWQMQMHAPEILDLSEETEATQHLYGIDQEHTADFGRQCLMARRLAEAGVRFIQVNYADNGSNPRWDQHSNIEQHETHARATDKPVAGLIADLKSRGLLDDTLVWWGENSAATPSRREPMAAITIPRGSLIFSPAEAFAPDTLTGQPTSSATRRLSTRFTCTTCMLRSCIYWDSTMSV